MAARIAASAAALRGRPVRPGGGLMPGLGLRMAVTIPAGREPPRALALWFRSRGARACGELRYGS
ncbi:hypothetical protein GCM10010336_03030 [Streptomyces goshikiensis]|nr:hypothetical protein GCM10010336_03030 [Streptomyces goshikiensis]